MCVVPWHLIVLPKQHFFLCATSVHLLQKCHVLEPNSRETEPRLWKWVTVGSSHGCLCLEQSAQHRCVSVAAAAGRLLVIRNNRAEFS